MENNAAQKSKREKVYINGYVWWVDRDAQMLYQNQDSNEADGICLYSNRLTDDEKRQVADFLRFGR